MRDENDEQQKLSLVSSVSCQGKTLPSRFADQSSARNNNGMTELREKW